MITKKLELIINTGQAEQALQGVDKAVNRIDKDLVKTDQEFTKVNKDAKDFDKNLQQAPKSTKKIVGGVKKIGFAMKAIGIGLLISAFTLLKELFGENQKVVDAFAIAFETVSIAFNDFFRFINDNVGTVVGYFKSLFEDPLGSLNKLGIAIEDFVMFKVRKLIETLGFLGDTVKHLFALDFAKAAESAGKAAGSIVDAVVGVDNAAEKITNTIINATNSITEYTKSTFKQAKSNIELKNSAELAALANQGLIEKFDLLAEKQRQIRDDERLSIAERKKANEELGLILKKQQSAMLENAQISLRSAKAELQKDKENIQFKKAVMEAENELAGVRASVAGFRSEQIVNEASLNKEELEIAKAKLASIANLSIEQKRFNAEQIDDKLKSLKRQQEIDSEERSLQTARLQKDIDSVNEGTQAKIDAQIALNEFKQQSDQLEITRLTEIEAEKLRIKTEADAAQEILDQAKEDKRLKRIEKEKQQDQEVQDLKFQLAQTTLSSIQTLTNAFADQSEENAKKAFNVQKALGMVQVGINTAQAIMAAAAQTTDFTPIQALRTGNMIAMGLAGAVQIAAIASQKFNPSGGSTSTITSPTAAGGGTSPSQPPSFNVVGTSGINQVAGALGSQPPIQAFVVAGAVTNAQQLQNNTINQATF